MTKLQSNGTTSSASDLDNKQLGSTTKSSAPTSSSLVEFPAGIIKQSVRLQLSSKLFPARFGAKKEHKKSNDIGGGHQATGEDHRSANVTKTDNAGFIGTDE